MRQRDVFIICETLMNRARAILGPKNDGYGDSHDALANLKGCGLMGYEPHEGVLIRIGDKTIRLHSLPEGEITPEVIEAILDNAYDLINYVGLYLACLVDEGKVTLADLGLVEAHVSPLSVRVPLGTLRARGTVVKPEADPLAKDGPAYTREGRIEGYFPPGRDLE